MQVLFKKLNLQGLEYWVCTLNGVEIAKANSEEGIKNRILYLINHSDRPLDKEEIKLAIKLT